MSFSCYENQLAQLFRKERMMWPDDFNLLLHHDLPGYGLVQMEDWYFPAWMERQRIHLYSNGPHPVSFWRDEEQGWIYLYNKAALAETDA